jgi:flagellar basal-body rod protein FlgC
MTMFPSIGVAGSGLVVDSTWLDALSSNISNAQDGVTPGNPVFRPEEVLVEPQQQAGVTAPGTPAPLGVQVQSLQYSGNPAGILKYDPSDPIAGPDGMVAFPDVPVGHELVSLVEAQTNFQANASVMQDSTNAYKAILDIKAG